MDRGVTAINNIDLDYDPTSGDLISFRHHKSAHLTVLFAPSAVFTDYEISSHKDSDQLATVGPFISSNITFLHI